MSHLIFLIFLPFKLVWKFLCGLALLVWAVTEQEKKSKSSHEWDDDLSTCIKCGDKDWMADKYCSESKLNKESK